MTTKTFAEYILDCLGQGFAVRRMMGEYCLYKNGVLVGLICDNRLLVKQTETSCRLLEGCQKEYPYSGSKTLMFVVLDPEDRPRMEELFSGLEKELQKRT